MESKSIRFYELDLFRFLAAISVVLFHYSFRGYAADDLSILSFPALGEIFKYGHLGVQFFFMISGFVVLLTALNNNFTGFVISRISRLYPAFWVSMTITSLVILVIGASRFDISLKQYFLNLTMVGSVLGVKPVDTVYWSLLIELRFYFLVGIVVLLNQTSRFEKFFVAWLIVVVFGLFVELPSAISYLLFPDWAPYFISGALFYVIRKSGMSGIRIFTITVCLLASVNQAILQAGEYELLFNSEFSPLVSSTIVVLFYLIMFLVSISALNAFNKAIMIRIGVLTYPLYLIHQNVGFMLFNHFGNSHNKYLIFFGVFVLMLFLSFIINRFIEERYRKKFSMFMQSLVRCVSQRLISIKAVPPKP